LLILLLSAIVFLFSSSTSKGLFYALIGVLAAVTYYLGQTEKRGSRAGITVGTIAVVLSVIGLLLFF
jgi:hypothetical protein